MRPSTVLQAFEMLWSELFSSPVHLDSAISKRPRNVKTLLAQIAPPILLRPASTAQQSGIGIRRGEPWNLSQAEMANWRSAHLMAERIHASMSSGMARPEPLEEDFPPEMLESWRNDFGPAITQELVRLLGKEAPMSLRVSRTMSAADLLKGMSAGSRLPTQVTLSEVSPQGLRFAQYAPVLSSDWGRGWYERGAFEIQDEGSQVMAYFALWPELFGKLLQQVPGPVREKSAQRAQPIALPDAVPAWTVVDACAGAGGKTLAIADALKGKGRVYAYDTAPKKLQALRRRGVRAQLNNIQAVALEEGAEEKTITRFRESADVVLVDAPCSGWGVLRRNPDIKWRQDRQSIERMPQIQKRLLWLYSKLVKPGGTLVFGVCTFRKAETTEIVDAFVSEFPEFEKIAGGYLGPDSSDGFFMQAFRKKKA